MDTVTVSKTFEGDAQEMAERCRSLDSRALWPGAVLMHSVGSTLYFQASVRLKAATMTDIDIEEKQGPLEPGRDGAIAFRTTQRCSWPDGVADGETTYEIVPGSPATLTFTYRYEPPSTKLVKTKALPAFHEGMHRVARRYVDNLVAATASAPAGQAGQA